MVRFAGLLGRRTNFINSTHIAIYNQSSNLPEREIFVMPDLGHVEYVPSVCLCLRGLHDLDVNIPYRIVAALNGLKQVLKQVIRVFSIDLDCLFSSQVLRSEGGLDMDLDIFEGSILSS